MQEKTSHSGLNLLIALIILIAIGVAGYFYMTRDRTSDSELLVSAPTGTGNDAVEGDLLTALGQLRQLTLDESVFGDAIFKSFTDYSKDLVPQAAGRPNPFAPFATTSPDSAFTTSSAAPTTPSTPVVTAPAVTTTPAPAASTSTPAR